MSGARFQRGDFVEVSYLGTTVTGMVLLASGNGRSLMLGFDGILRVPGGGFFVSSMPVLQDEAGAYRDLIAGEIVALKRFQPGSAPTA